MATKDAGGETCIPFVSEAIEVLSKEFVPALTIERAVLALFYNHALCFYVSP